MWTSQFNWYMNSSSIPPGIDAAATLQSIRDAGTAWATVYNDCGIGDGSNLSVAYQGITAASVQMNSSGTLCLDFGNGVSSVGFGTLQYPALGATCVWVTGFLTATESDVRLNYNSSWANAGFVGCSTTYVIRPAMTHERGHTFGLAHLAEGTHGNLTMGASIDYCSTQEATLGLGDANGINTIY